MRERAARLERSAAMWERGAEGEAATAAALAELEARGWATFHDVRWPGRQRANIDHVVVGPGGVFVIDSKNWSGDVRVVDGVLRQDGRRREREVAAAAEAALALTPYLGGLAATPVLCFTRPEPVEGWARDVMLCSTHDLSARLAAQPAILGRDSISRVTTILRGQLAPARDRLAGTLTAPHLRRAGGSGRRLLEPHSGRRPVIRRFGRLVVGLVGAGLVALVGLGLVFSLLGRLVDGLGQAAGSTGGAGSTADVGTSSVDADAPAVLGMLGRLPAGPSHPALQVKTGKALRVASTRPDDPLQQAKHLVAVRYSVRNVGGRPWGAAPPYPLFSALASNGEHVSRGSYAALPAGKLLPAAFNLRPGATRRGYVIFAVPNGAKLVRVSFSVGFGSHDALEWLVA
jgi:hypothetical protein